MATGSEGELEAVRHAHLRASHADREQVIDTLKVAFVQGRLAKEELDERISRTFASRTYAELAALTADLPAGLADAVPSGRAARAPTQWWKTRAAQSVLWVVIAVAVPVLLTVPVGSDQLFLLFTPFYFAALAFLGAEIAASGHKKQPHGGQLPPGQMPGLGGQASARLPSVGPGRHIPPADPGERHSALAGRRRPPQPALPVRWHYAGGALTAGTTPTGG